MTPGHDPSTGPERAHTFYGFLAAVRRFEVGSPGLKLTLIILSEYMGLEGGEWCGCPGQDRLARESEQSTSTVRRHIRALETLGLITTRLRYGNDGKRTSSVYVFDLDRLEGNMTSSSASLEVMGGPTRGHLMTSEGPEEEPVLSLVPSGTDGRGPLGFPTAHAIRTGTPYPEPFEAFWQAFPRRIGKTAAYKAWLARLTEGRKAGVSVERRTGAMVVAAGNYAAAVAGRDTEHVKYPATFLGPADHWKEYVNTTTTAEQRSGPRRDPGQVYSEL